MSALKLITKKELEDFLVMQERIRSLIKLKSVQLSLILYGRIPYGETVDFDIEEYEPKSGCIHVEYKECVHGEGELERYDLPFEFLYDSKYPAVYKEKLKEKQRISQEENEREQLKANEKLKISLEKYERNEYERLKLKFEGSN